MSVDFRDCDSCGDSYNLCECGRMICNDCLTAPKEHDDSGYILPECCPYCSGQVTDPDDLLDFLLEKYCLDYDEVVEMYRKSKKE